MVTEFGVMFVVRRINLHYQRPARLDELIRIESRILETGGASLILAQNFWRGSDSLAVLEVGLACVNAQTGRAARLPAAWAARLMQ
jgi:acyl-CoA thioester hydrolase